MRLIDLAPQWLVKDGRRVGFVFRCPHCADKPLGRRGTDGCYLSCFTVALAHVAGDDHDSQYGLFATVLPADVVHEIVPCRRGYAWTATPSLDQAAFETLTITPSIDASAARHWHGRIIDGEIR
jgi:hypothetical protein